MPDLQQDVSPLGAQFDPFEGDPYAFYRRAREEEPVFYSPILDYWVITRYDDVHEIMRETDGQTFSAANALDPIAPLCPATLAKLGEYEYVPRASLVNMDPPDHGRWRQILRKAFTPERVQELEPMTRELVTHSIDGFVKRGEADVVKDLMWEVPSTVILKMMGFPDAELDEMKSHAARLAVFGWGKPSEEEQVRLAGGIGEYWRLGKRHVDRLIEEPGDDVMSELIRAWKTPGNEDLADVNDLYTLCINLLMAGHETTTNASAAAFRALLGHREQWEAICADPSLIPNAVEEVLRFDSSVPTWRRVASKAVTIRGVDIPEGARLLVGLGSANHDEERFPDGDRFDIRRENANEHMAFGWGRHTCLGARLARMEMRVVLEEATRRLPHLQLPDQEWHYSPNTSHRGPERVLVTWDPSENPVPEDRP
jgi:cytochrome P450